MIKTMRDRQVESKVFTQRAVGNKIFGAGAHRWLSSPCVAKNFWLYLSPLHGIVPLSFDESPIHLCSVTGTSHTECLSHVSLTHTTISCHGFATYA